MIDNIVADEIRKRSKAPASWLMPSAPCLAKFFTHLSFCDICIDYEHTEECCRKGIDMFWEAYHEVEDMRRPYYETLRYPTKILMGGYAVYYNATASGGEVNAEILNSRQVTPCRDTSGDEEVPA